MWKFGLIEDMKNPEKIVFSDDLVVVLKDRFPKAQDHFLVLPHKNIHKVSDVEVVDVNLLKHMDRTARDIVEKYNCRIFKFGYHAEPSMDRLHLHVISDDMVSPTMKHTKHWNSFTTPYFIDSREIIRQLETNGRVKIPSKSQISSWLATPLKCHKCNFTPKKFSQLKNHLLIHLE